MEDITRIEQTISRTTNQRDESETKMNEAERLAVECYNKRLTLESQAASVGKEEAEYKEVESYHRAAREGYSNTLNVLYAQLKEAQKSAREVDFHPPIPSMPIVARMVTTNESGMPMPVIEAGFESSGDSAQTEGFEYQAEVVGREPEYEVKDTETQKTWDKARPRLWWVQSWFKFNVGDTVRFRGRGYSYPEGGWAPRYGPWSEVITWYVESDDGTDENMRLILLTPVR